jgi:Flp pilus assembly protein CpaB
MAGSVRPASGCAIAASTRAVAVAITVRVTGSGLAMPESQLSVPAANTPAPPGAEYQARSLKSG